MLSVFSHGQRPDMVGLAETLRPKGIPVDWKAQAGKEDAKLWVARGLGEREVGEP